MPLTQDEAEAIARKHFPGSGIYLTTCAVNAIMEAVQSQPQAQAASPTLERSMFDERLDTCRQVLEIIALGQTGMPRHAARDTLVKIGIWRPDAELQTAVAQVPDLSGLSAQIKDLVVHLPTMPSGMTPNETIAYFEARCKALDAAAELVQAALSQLPAQTATAPDLHERLIDACRDVVDAYESRFGGGNGHRLLGPIDSSVEALRDLIRSQLPAPQAEPCQLHMMMPGHSRDHGDVVICEKCGTMAKLREDVVESQPLPQTEPLAPKVDSDQVLEVAIALEQQRALQIVLAVAALHPVDDMPTPLQTGWNGACEEIAYRLGHEEWLLGDTPTPLPKQAEPDPQQAALDRMADNARELGLDYDRQLDAAMTPKDKP